jgi:hypothetical protein
MLPWLSGMPYADASHTEPVLVGGRCLCKIAHPSNPFPGPGPSTATQPERNSPVKNRMRETGTSGSVRGAGGNILGVWAAENFKHVEQARRQFDKKGGTD